MTATSSMIAALSTSYLSALTAQVVCANGQYAGYPGWGTGSLSASGGSGANGNWTYNTAYNTNLGSTYSMYQDPMSKLEKRLIAIEERLCILSPDFYKQKKFAALQTAYNNYKLLEKLCVEEQEP